MTIFKRIFFTSLVLAFGFFVVAVSIVRDQANTIKVKPALNQPMYLVEVIQDRITQWLTYDSSEKLRLWLNYADERWLSADELLHNKQEASGLLMARKAVGYQTKAVDQIEAMKTNSKDVKEAIKNANEAIQRGERLMLDWQKDNLIQDSAEWNSLMKLMNYSLERLGNLRE